MGTQRTRVLHRSICDRICSNIQKGIEIVMSKILLYRLKKVWKNENYKWFTLRTSVTLSINRQKEKIEFLQQKSFF